jgi:hypothetical protein
MGLGSGKTGGALQTREAVYPKASALGAPQSVEPALVGAGRSALRLGHRGVVEVRVVVLRAISASLPRDAECPIYGYSVNLAPIPGAGRGVDILARESPGAGQLAEELNDLEEVAVAYKRLWNLRVRS